MALELSKKTELGVSAIQVKYPAPKNVVIAIEFTDSQILVHPNICSTNVWGNNCMGKQMSGVVIQQVNKVRPWQKSQVNKCLGKKYPYTELPRAYFVSVWHSCYDYNLCPHLLKSIVHVIPCTVINDHD